MARLHQWQELRNLVSAADHLWQQYRQLGPGKVDRKWLRAVEVAHAAYAESRRAESLRTIHRGLDQWCRQAAVDAAETLLDLSRRCVLRSEGLCFVSGEAGLIPRKDLINRFEFSRTFLAAMTNANSPLNRKLRMALIGGGGAGFIGRVHFTAATLDNRAELVAGAFSSNPEKSRANAGDFGVAPERAYGSYRELIDGELERPPAERIDFLSIATPNHTHFEIARAAVEAGFNVVCDKPLTNDLQQARELAVLVRRCGVVFAVSHNYTGYPMIRQAREMVAAGDLGQIQAVRANYMQGWMWGVDPETTPARGAWKSDPAKTGPSATMGDIGTHAYNLLRYVTGLQPREVSATLQSYHPGSRLDDYGHTIIRFENGALGMISVSQVTHGRLNDLTLEVDGTKASLSWRQEQPNELIVRRFGQPMQTYERNPNAGFMSAAGRDASRLPGGHPEAFFEAFGNIYRGFYDDVIRRALSQPIDPQTAAYPTVDDGVSGVALIQQCVASSRDNSAWKPLTD